MEGLCLRMPNHVPSKTNNLRTGVQSSSLRHFMLKDNALRHWTALLRNNPDHPALHQWRVYIKEFTSIFGPHNTACDTEIALVKLKMFDNNRFSNFLVQFEAEAFETGWDYQAIAFHLCTSIAPRLREGLRIVAPTTSYAELKGALMQIETQYWETEAVIRVKSI